VHLEVGRNTLHRFDRRRVLAVRSMREIEPHHVGPGANERAQSVGVARCGPDRRDDLRTANGNLGHALRVAPRSVRTSGESFVCFWSTRTRAPIPNPVIRWGFRLFGRPTQLRFYRSVQRRLRQLVQAAQRGEPLPEPAVRADGLAIAPSGTTPHPLERFSRASHHPGR